MSKNVKTALLLLLLVFAVIATFAWSVMKKTDEAGVQIIKMYPSNKTLPEFSLTDESNRQFSNQSLPGKWSLVFFGYTHCPDVCPATMSNLARVMKNIPVDDQNNIQVVLVSVDPERDNINQLKTYVEFFNKNFKGVTGKDEQLQMFSQSLGAIYFKGEVDEKGNYAVDHTSKVFLINPEGKRAGLFDGQAIPPAKEFPAERIAKDLQFLLKTHRF